MTKAQATVFSLVLAGGIGTTIFTFQHLKKERETLVVDEHGEIQSPDAAKPEGTASPTIVPEPDPVPTPPAPPAPDPVDERAELFRQPEKLLGAFADLAAARDADAFIELAGKENIDADTLPRLVDLLEDQSYAPATDEPVMSLARVGDATRWSIQFEPVGQIQNASAPATSGAATTANPEPTTPPQTPSAPISGEVPATVTAPDADTPPAPTRSDAATGISAPADRPAATPSADAPPAPTTTTDLAPTAPGDPLVPASPTKVEPRETDVQLVAIADTLPKRQIYIDLRQADPKTKTWEIAQVLVPATINRDPNSTSILPPSADPVTVAHHFADAVMSGDFKTARALSDPDKVTDERIAALMIAIEEGDYDLHNDRPLTQTLARDTVSWIIARVKNADMVSEFAMEMSNLDPEVGWRIDSMSFDKMIQMTSAAAGGGDVAYAPIVKNPQGGDSLVLFFDFDGDQLNARAMRQVEIIADILKANPARQININGHADALGLDDYNIKLSARRASEVKTALLSLGVAVDQVITKGFGEAAPVSPNFKPDGSDNPSGRSHNRRTEVYLNF